MTNEMLSGIFLALEFCFLFGIAFFAQEKKWIFGFILTNAFLISIFGAKIVDIFGFSSNVGNIPYAAIFLATQVLIVREKKISQAHKVYQVIPFYILLGGMFTVFSQIIVLYSSISDTWEFDSMIRKIFAVSPHIAGASMLAYLFAQQTHIKIFLWLEKKTAGKWLAFRSLLSAGIGQCVDSILFFTIAFSALSANILVETAITGLVIKVIVACAGVPFLYILAKKYEKLV